MTGLAYEPAAWRRLTELKATYDPAGVLRPGFAIPPRPSPVETKVAREARRRG